MIRVMVEFPSWAAWRRAQMPYLPYSTRAGAQVIGGFSAGYLLVHNPYPLDDDIPF